ncbi:hypothetical protein DFQ26_003992, partial [Actinomortierella ambigua]
TLDPTPTGSQADATTTSLPFLIFAVANEDQLNNVLKLELVFPNSEMPPATFEKYEETTEKDEQSRSIQETSSYINTLVVDVSNALAVPGDVNHVRLHHMNPSYPAALIRGSQTPWRSFSVSYAARLRRKMREEVACLCKDEPFYDIFTTKQSSHSRYD